VNEPDPVGGFHDKDGKFYHVHKYSLYWGGYETEYAPRSTEQLAAAREKREEKAAAK
jgi:hypothetical protein